MFSHEFNKGELVLKIRSERLGKGDTDYRAIFAKNSSYIRGIEMERAILGFSTCDFGPFMVALSCSCVTVELPGLSL